MQTVVWSGSALFANVLLWDAGCRSVNVNESVYM